MSTPLLPLTSKRLNGRHLVADVMAAATVAQIAGVPQEAMVRAVESFTGLEHALEPVAVVNGVRFINDSKATNVEAAQRAIESFDRGLVVIMGGRFKSGDFSLLREPLRSRSAKVVAIGEAAPLIERALEGAVTVERAATLEAAVKDAYGLARTEVREAPRGEGSLRMEAVVLLAPACASFDMFRDYAERGQVFKTEVLTLMEGSKLREQ
jgi:UDP-N-acetylmuramoylalanine--D-glutamate ligase